VGGSESQPVLTDVLTLELSFGDEKTIDKDKFLLAKPKGLAVNDKGDIFVTDENSVKVFDKYGKEKLILGRTGQGPGEFSRSGYITISDSGLISAANGSSYNLYSPDFEFIKSVRPGTDERMSIFLKDQQLSSSDIIKVITLSESEKYIEFRSPSRAPVSPNIFKMNRIVLYKNEKTIKTISTNPKYYHMLGKIIPFTGDLLWDILNENQVIYTQSNKDMIQEANTGKYILNIWSPEFDEITQIIKDYIPVKIPDSEIKDEFTSFIEANDDETEKFVRNHLKELDYNYPAVRWIRTDNNYVFVGTNQRNKKDEYLIDVFDANQMLFLSSFYSPFKFDLVKNGYVYRIKSERNEFPVIEKYKIDPAVYGK